MFPRACADAVCPQAAPSADRGRPRREVADIFRLWGERRRSEHRLCRDQLNVMSLIGRCRTPALGGHLDRYDTCGYELPSYNSCRNRQRPKSQTLAKERWLQERREELLPVGYFRLVFTVPDELNLLVLRNKRALLPLLFTAVADTLQAFAHDPQWRPHGQLGFLGVLHTCSQTLVDRFHLHVLIPAGVLQTVGNWRSAGESFLFGTQSLAKAFRSRYLDLLGRCYRQNTLLFAGSTSAVAAPEEFVRRFLLHVLPAGFMKIRHFGFLANPCKTANLRRIRAQLGRSPRAQTPELPVESVAEMMLRFTGEDITGCPRCREGRLVVVAELPALPPIAHREAFDTS